MTTEKSRMGCTVLSNHYGGRKMSKQNIYDNEAFLKTSNKYGQIKSTIYNKKEP